MRSKAWLMGGVTALLLGVGTVAFAVQGWRMAHEMAGTLSALAEGQGVPFDPADWVARWRSSLGILGLLGAMAVMAGIGIIQQRRWGLVLWAGAITLSLLACLLTTTVRSTLYAFEQTSAVEFGLLSILCIAAWVAVWRKGGLS